MTLFDLPQPIRQVIWRKARFLSARHRLAAVWMPPAFTVKARSKHNWAQTLVCLLRPCKQLVVVRRFLSHWRKTQDTNRWYGSYATRVFECIDIREEVSHVSVKVYARGGSAFVAYSNVTVTRYRRWNDTKEYLVHNTMWWPRLGCYCTFSSM